MIEWEEWGNPGADPEVYAVMKSYSPYDNVGPVHYPDHVGHRRAGGPPGRLLGADQVGPEAAGRRPREPGPVQGRARVAGHAGPSGRYDAWRDEAFVLSFILDAVGLTELTAQAAVKSRLNGER